MVYSDARLKRASVAALAGTMARPEWLRARDPQTPEEGLFHAIRSGGPQDVAGVLESGVSARGTESPTGLGPVWLATALGMEGALRVLLEMGGDPDESHSGIPALVEASLRGFVGCARLLLEAGARVDEKGGSGGAALFHAATDGPEELLSLLLSAGADPSSTGRIATGALGSGGRVVDCATAARLCGREVTALALEALAAERALLAMEEACGGSVSQRREVSSV